MWLAQGVSNTIVFGLSRQVRQICSPFDGDGETQFDNNEALSYKISAENYEGSQPEN